MHNVVARGYFINLTKLHLTLSQSQLTLEYLGCAWVVFSDYYGQKEMFSLDADYLAMRLVVIKDNCLFRGEWRGRGKSGEAPFEFTMHNA